MTKINGSMEIAPVIIREVGGTKDVTQGYSYLNYQPKFETKMSFLLHYKAI